MATEKTENPAKAEKPETSGKPEKRGKPGNPRKTEKPEKPEKLEKPETSEKKQEATRPATERSRKSRTASRPVLMAGIDIGSTAMRMNIAEIFPDLPDSPIRIVEELTHPAAAGADAFRHGRILPGTMSSLYGILENFFRLLDDYGVQHRRFVASSAVREAANRDVLVDRVRHRFGLELEVLDAIEESRLAYQALLPWFRQYPGSYSMALSIGGGSTEIMILRGEDLQLGGAKRLGTARLFHAVGQSRGEILRHMTANIVSNTRNVYQDYSISHFFLINRILYRAFRNDPAAERREHDCVIAADTLRERLQKAYSLSPMEVGRTFNMGLTEVETLIPAMMILENFVTASEADAVTLTDTELLTGLLAEMAMTIRGESPLMSFRRQMVRAARAIGERFSYDRTHARLVTEFSLLLFDALRDMLDLGDRDRLLLELSAVLHDVGVFVAEHRHHRHSAYLIKWSDIVGLNEHDRVLAAQIAFFHRKELPSSEHAEYMALSREDRMRVSKLAGILRLADVLDRGHRQDVKSLRVELGDDKLLLHLEIAGDLGLILDALPRKSDLLEQVLGLPVVLRRELPRV